jgi:hypothetical protein
MAADLYRATGYSHAKIGGYEAPPEALAASRP